MNPPPHPFCPDPSLGEITRANQASSSARLAPRLSLFALLLATPLRRNLLVAVTLAVIGGLGSWTYQGVRRSLQEIRASELTTVLDAEVKGLEVWSEEKKREAERWAQDPRVRQSITELVAISREGPQAGERLWRSPARARLFEILAPVMQDTGSVTVNVIDRSGVVVATRFREYAGVRVPAATLAHLEEIFQGHTRFVRPLREEARIGAGPLPLFPRPVLWVEAPVRNDRGEIMAALGFARFADEEFTNILKVARPGKTGEVYAFDESGLMLSESRFNDELKRVGLLPDSPEARSALTVQVRDPGGDLTAGHVPDLEPAARPLTRLAALAVASRFKSDSSASQRGVLVEPYRNYRGVEVIGAWKWLPEYDMGVAVEVGAHEAFAPLTYLNIMFGTLFGLFTLSVLAALGSSFLVERLRRQVGEARQLGPYKLEREIGEGGMSRVYLATHALLKRPTAVKILKPAVATDEMIARFEREVRLASQLSHPNTIEIYDYGRSPEGVFFYAMEYLNGVTLEALVGCDGAIPAPRAIHILRQLCGSLREAHAKGLVHRDVKPQNIMLCERGGEFDVVKVLDFGLVKDLDKPDPRDITQFLRILGTPLYMAPERIRHPASADPRSDVYSVGAVAFHLLTGRRLFEAETDLDLTHQVLNAPPRRPSECAPGEIPEELDNLVLRCLAKDPAARPQRMEELLMVLYVLSAWHPWTQSAAAEWWQRYRASGGAALPSPAAQRSAA